MSSENNYKDKWAKPKKRKKKQSNFYYDFVKITGALPTLLWMRPKVYYPYGKKKIKGGALISANHRGFLDPIIVHVVFKSRRLHCLATTDLYNTPRKTWFFNKMHCIPVDKSNFSISSFHEVVTRLSDGKAVVIFPEGQINNQGSDGLLTFKSGAVLMAHKSRAPIVPVYIVHRTRWYQRQRAVVGLPVDVCSMLGERPSLEDLSRVSELLRVKEMELKDYYESLHKKGDKK